jgi:MFS transporter, ACS family, hexuronate transporter
MIIPWVALAWGWRSTFVFAGLAGLLWLLLWFPLYDLPEKAKRLRAEELAYIRQDPPDEPGGKVGWREVLRYRQTWSFVVGKLLTDPAWWFLLTWLPDYFKKSRGLDLKNSWLHLATIYSIATLLSVVGSWMVGQLGRRVGMSRARKIGLFACAVGVTPILLVSRAGNWEAVLLIGLAAGAHQTWSANLFTTTSDMFPKRAVASVVGVGGMAGSITGLFFPIYAGILLDKTAALGSVSAGYAILFGFCGFAYLLAFFLNHLLAPSFKPVQMRELPVPESPTS